MVELFKANLIIDYCSHFITDVYDLSIDEKEEFFVNKILFHNCRCHSEPVDYDYIQENDKTVSKGSDYLDAKDPETGNPYIPEQFRYNPGIQGAMPNDSSYFEVLSSANKGNAKLFEDDSNEQKLTNLKQKVNDLYEQKYEELKNMNPNSKEWEKLRDETAAIKRYNARIKGFTTDTVDTEIGRAHV